MKFGRIAKHKNKLLDTDPANFEEAVNEARSFEFRSNFLKTHKDNDQDYASANYILLEKKIIGR